MEEKPLDMDQIHKRELKCLAFLDRVCREHNLTYSLAYGTLLGAIRHKGFIPWDDDADVMMPAADYGKLVKLFATGKISDPSFKFFNPDLDRSYYYIISRLADVNSRIVPTNGDREIPGLGVFIDIYPYYFAFDDEILHELVYREAEVSQWERDGVAFRLRKIYQSLKMAASFFYGANNPDWIPGGNLPRLSEKNKLRILKLIKFLYKIAGSRWAYWWYRYLLSCLPKASPIYYDPHSMTFFESSLFATPIDVDFEGHKFKATPIWERVLVSIYGDYNTPPSPDQRGSRHNYKAYALR